MHQDPGYSSATTRVAMVSKDISRDILSIIKRANKASFAFDRKKLMQIRKCLLVQNMC